MSGIVFFSNSPFWHLFKLALKTSKSRALSRTNPPLHTIVFSHLTVKVSLVEDPADAA